MRRDRRTMPRCYRSCLMTAAAKPGRRKGGGTLDCRTRDLVLMEGGATRAAAVATWALVRARGDVLVGVAALRSRTMSYQVMETWIYSWF